MPEVACPNCQTRLNAPENLQGREVTCGQCGRTFVVPPAAEAGPIPVSPPAAPPPVPAGGTAPPPLSSPTSPSGRTSGLATAALVLGVTSLPACLCYAVPGLICGVMAIIFGTLARGAVARGEAGGSSLRQAKAGLICGIIGIILSLAVAVAFALLIWWTQTRQARSVYYQGY